VLPEHLEERRPRRSRRRRRRRPGRPPRRRRRRARRNACQLATVLARHHGVPNNPLPRRIEPPLGDFPLQAVEHVVEAANTCEAIAEALDGPADQVVRDPAVVQKPGRQQAAVDCLLPAQEEQLQPVLPPQRRPGEVVRQGVDGSQKVWLPGGTPAALRRQGRHQVREQRRPVRDNPDQLVGVLPGVGPEESGPGQNGQGLNPRDVLGWSSFPRCEFPDLPGGEEISDPPWGARSLVGRGPCWAVGAACRAARRGGVRSQTYPGVRDPPPFREAKTQSCTLLRWTVATAFRTLPSPGVLPSPACTTAADNAHRRSSCHEEPSTTTISGMASGELGHSKASPQSWRTPAALGPKMAAET